MPLLNQLHIYSFPLDIETEKLQSLKAILSPDEVQRAERYYFEHDRVHFTVARGTLRKTLSQYTGISPEKLQFQYEAKGKPYLDIPDLTFNLSHSHGMAVLGIGEGAKLGIDIEQIKAKPDLINLAGRFFSPAEIAAITTLPPSLQIEAFYNCWTRKEAYLKAEGSGISVPLDSFVVSLTPGEKASLKEINGSTFEAEKWVIEAFQPVEGYAAALCIENTRPWEYNYFKI